MAIPMDFDVIEILRTYLQYVMLADWRALPVLAVAMLISVCLRTHLAAKYHAMLWSLVILRLLMPISIINPWSVHGPIDQAALSLLEGEPENHGVAVLPQPFVFTGKSSSESQMSVQQSENANAPIIREAPERPVATPTAAEPIAWGPIIADILFYAFVGGAFVFLIRNAMAYVRFARMLDRCPIIEEPNLILLVNRECRNLGIARIPLVKEVRELNSPAVFGLFRSTICLPTGITQSLSANELRWVVRHELAHIGRFDSWMMMLAAIARSMHWFNPLAWLATAKLRSYIESAADQVAISSSDGADATAYGHLLIRIAEQSPPQGKSVALGLLPFASVGSLKRRLMWLSNAHRPKREWTNWFAMLAVLGCVGFVLTDATASEDDGVDHSAPSKPYKRPTQFSVEIVSPTASATDVISKHQIDLTNILPKVKEVWTSSQDPASELVSLCKGFNRSVNFQLDGNMLSIESTAAQAEPIRQMLDAWASSGPKQVSVELRILHIEMRYASAIDWMAHRIDHTEQDGGMVAAKIGFNELMALSRVALSAQDSEFMFAPKVTLFNGQCVCVSDAYRQPYVTAMKFKRDEGNETTSTEPVISEREIGLKALFTAVIAGEDNVRMTFDLHRNRVDRVAIADLPYFQHLEPDEIDANGSKVSSGIIVQVPSFSTSSIKSTVELLPRETILIASPEPYPEDSPAGPQMITLYAITPRVLDVQ